jgi:hypothetical protein
MSLILTFLLVAFQNQTITASSPPVPVPRALEMLSKASGQKLRASADFKDQVLVFRLKDAPTELVLKYIADSLTAKWESRQDGTLALEQDVKAMQRMADSESIANRSRLSKSLVDLRKQLANEPRELDEAAINKYLAKQQDAEKRLKLAQATNDFNRILDAPDDTEGSSAWRALTRTVLTIDPAELLAMTEDEREVWAENPTAMQRPMPEAAVDLLAIYRREFALLSPGAEVNRVEIICEKSDEGPGLSVHFRAFDLAGDGIDEADFQVAYDPIPDENPLKGRLWAETAVAQAPIEIPETIREIRTAFSPDLKGIDRSTLFGKYKPRMIDPVKYEPTSPFDGENFVLAAEAVDVNVIGKVWDYINNSPLTAKELAPAAILSTPTIHVLPAEDRWVVFRPAEASAVCSRANARDLIAQSIRQGGLTVDAAAEWAAQTPGDYVFVNWVGTYLSLLFGDVGRYRVSATTFNDIGLRLWAGLGSGVLERLRHGESVRLSALSDETKAQIAKEVFWHGGLKDDKIEPTDRLPNGITDGILTMTIKDTPVITGWSSDSTPPSTPYAMDAKTFGRYLAQGDTYRHVKPDVYRAYNRFKVGNNRVYELHFTIDPGELPMTMRLTETLFPPDLQELSQLPDDIKAIVDQTRKATPSAPIRPIHQDVVPPPPPLRLQ